MLRFYCDWEVERFAFALCERLDLDPDINYDEKKNRWSVDAISYFWIHNDNGFYTIGMNQLDEEKLMGATQFALDQGFRIVKS